MASRSAAGPSTESMQESHPVVFKVSRLNRPSFFNGEGHTHTIPGLPCPVTGKIQDIEHDTLGPLVSSAALQMPKGFGNIYLGESLWAYVAVWNQSANDVTNLAVKVELQFSARRVALLDTSKQPVALLKAGKSSEHILKHDVSEDQAHTMICNAVYKTRTGEDRRMRQYFKFQVNRPMVVNTKIHTIEEKVFLEHELQNVSQTAMFFQRVVFDPSEHYECEDLNELDDDPVPSGTVRQSSVLVLSSQSLLKPGEIRQFVYILKPKNGLIDPSDKTRSKLGRLEMKWKGPMGEPGRLLTVVDLMQWKLQPRKEIEIKVLEVPQTVSALQPFEVVFRIYNRTNSPLHGELHLPTSVESAIVAHGVGTVIIPAVPVGSYRDIDARFIALADGIQSLSGISMVVSGNSSQDTAVSPKDFQLLVQAP